MQMSRPTTRAAVAASSLLAVVLLAVVPAFACTPRSTAQIEPASGPAGSSASVTGSLYDPQYAVVIKFGGAGGPVMATAAVRPDGSFGPVPVVIPATTQPGTISVLAVYQPDDPVFKVSNVTFEVPGVPVPAPAPAAPSPSTEPAPAPAAATAPTAQATPAPAAVPATQPRVRPAPSAAAAAPTPAPAEPVPAATPAPAPEAQVAPATPVAEQPAAPRPAVRTTAPSRSVDDGTPMWVLVPLIGLGLFAATTAVVVAKRWRPGRKPAPARSPRSRR